MAHLNYITEEKYFIYNKVCNKIVWGIIPSQCKSLLDISKLTQKTLRPVLWSKSANH